MENACLDITRRTLLCSFFLFHSFSKFCLHTLLRLSIYFHPAPLPLCLFLLTLCCPLVDVPSLFPPPTPR
jgi:hypothetical protein